MNSEHSSLSHPPLPLPQQLVYNNWYHHTIVITPYNQHITKEIPQVELSYLWGHLGRRLDSNLGIPLARRQYGHLLQELVHASQQVFDAATLVGHLPENLNIPLAMTLLSMSRGPAHNDTMSTVLPGTSSSMKYADSTSYSNMPITYCPSGLVERLPAFLGRFFLVT